VEVKSDRRIIFPAKDQAKVASLRARPRTAHQEQPDQQWGGRVHHDSTSKARVPAITAHVRTVAADHIQHCQGLKTGTARATLKPSRITLERAMPSRPWQDNTQHLFSQAVVTGHQPGCRRHLLKMKTVTLVPTLHRMSSRESHSASEDEKERVLETSRDKK
jgi:hypothetical protein